MRRRKPQPERTAASSSGESTIESVVAGAECVSTLAGAGIKRREQLPQLQLDRGIPQNGPAAQTIASVAARVRRIGRTRVLCRRRFALPRGWLVFATGLQ